MKHAPQSHNCPATMLLSLRNIIAHSCATLLLTSTPTPRFPRLGGGTPPRRVPHTPPSTSCANLFSFPHFLKLKNKILKI